MAKITAEGLVRASQELQALHDLYPEVFYHLDTKTVALVKEWAKTEKRITDVGQVASGIIIARWILGGEDNGEYCEI